MSYSLYRTRDRAGDTGLMSDLCIPEIDPANPNRALSWTTEHNARPRIGGLMRVGSHYARSYSAQDYWQTSLITEILEERDDYVRFKTGNSEYEWSVK